MLVVEVDYVILKSQGGMDDDDNFQVICDFCYKVKIVREVCCQGLGGLIDQFF